MRTLASYVEQEKYEGAKERERERGLTKSGSGIRGPFFEPLLHGCRSGGAYRVNNRVEAVLRPRVHAARLPRSRAKNDPEREVNTGKEELYTVHNTCYAVLGYLWQWRKKSYIIIRNGCMWPAMINFDKTKQLDWAAML